MKTTTAARAVVETLVTNQNHTSFDYGSLAEAFPEVDPGLAPFGNIGLFQIRRPKNVTKGGVILTGDDKSTEYYNTQVAKVIALGPLCFKMEADGKLIDWPEGRWFEIGDFVRIPKMGGDRFSVPHLYRGKQLVAGKAQDVDIKGEVLFALYRVKDILGKITGDPLAVKAFLD